MYSQELDLELQLIQDTEILDFTKMILVNIVHPLFYRKPASSTGKYHPESSLGDGGLLRHTKMVVAVANIICNSNMFMDTRISWPVIFSACILHDAWKYDQDGQYHSTKLHATKAVDSINAFVEHENVFVVKPDWYFDILNCIFTHNGFHVSSESMPIERMNINQRIVHIADMISSRRYIEFDLEEYKKSFAITPSLPAAPKQKPDKELPKGFDGDMVL